MNDEFLPLDLSSLASFLIWVEIREAFKSLLSVVRLRTEAKAALVVQEVEEITGGTLGKEVVAVIVGRGMEDPVLVALRMMGLMESSSIKLRTQEGRIL